MDNPDNFYFGWVPSQPVIFDWPSFSSNEGEEDRDLVSEDGRAIKQEIHPMGEEAINIEMVFPDQIDEEYTETTRSLQLWEKGQPWWTEASIRVEYREKEGVEEVVLIKGKRL